MKKQKVCVWEKVDDETIRTGCKKLHDSVIQFIFWDNKFCPYCGKEIEVLK